MFQTLVRKREAACLWLRLCSQVKEPDHAGGGLVTWYWDGKGGTVLLLSCSLCCG